MWPWQRSRRPSKKSGSEEAGLGPHHLRFTTFVLGQLKSTAGLIDRTSICTGTSRSISNIKTNQKQGTAEARTRVGTRQDSGSRGQVSMPVEGANNASPHRRKANESSIWLRQERSPICFESVAHETFNGCADTGFAVANAPR